MKAEVYMQAISIAVSLLVVITNLVIRFIGQKLIDWIGYHLNEEILMSMMTLIFVCQYINTAIVLVVASAEVYPDYTNEWYLVVGQELQ